MTVAQLLRSIMRRSSAFAQGYSMTGRAPLQGEKFLPGFGQARCFYLARNSPFKFGMKRSARAVNHDHVFRTFRPNGMRDAGRNDNADVILATMIVAIDKQTHGPRR